MTDKKTYEIHELLFEIEALNHGHFLGLIEQIKKGTITVKEVKNNVR